MILISTRLQWGGRDEVTHELVGNIYDTDKVPGEFYDNGETRIVVISEIPLSALSEALGEHLARLYPGD